MCQGLFLLLLSIQLLTVAFNIINYRLFFHSLFRLFLNYFHRFIINLFLLLINKFPILFLKHLNSLIMSLIISDLDTELHGVLLLLCFNFLRFSFSLKFGRGLFLLGYFGYISGVD